jgi:hypothetical protein
MQLQLLSLQHFNVLVEDYGATLAHMRDVFGAQLNYELEPRYLSEGVQACLMTLGPVIFELVGAAPGSKNAFRRKLDKDGPGYIGIEFEVRDLAAAREAARQNGIRVKYDPGTFFVTDPRDTFGLTIECFDRNWHVDPPDPRMVPVAPRDYWTNEHPLGITGLYGFTVEVADRQAAAARWREVAGADIVEESDAGEPLWLSAADTQAGLVNAPRDGGRERILAARFTVRDIDQTTSALASKGLKLEEDRNGLMVASAAKNRGVRLEFIEVR